MRWTTKRLYPRLGVGVALYAALFLLSLPLLLCAAEAADRSTGQPIPRPWLWEWPETDFSQAAVPFDEIISGGPPKDGIPSIDAPAFEPVGALSDPIPASEPLLSVAIDGDARGYPLRILIWHEIVNDTVGGRPIAVTFCPLCNSGVVFDRRVAGAETTFGTTGKLRHSDLVMYDRATESWWQQFEGRAIVGTRTGVELQRVPARLESVETFQERHPDGKILIPGDRYQRAYGMNPYAGYDSAERPFLFDGRYEGPGTPMMRVVAVEGEDRAWSLDLVRAEGEITHDDLVIAFVPGQSSALDAQVIAEGRPVGGVTVQRRSTDGRLVDVPHDVPFAFAFSAFKPGAPIHHLVE